MYVSVVDTKNFPGDTNREKRTNKIPSDVIFSVLIYNTRYEVIPVRFILSQANITFANYTLNTDRECCTYTPTLTHSLFSTTHTHTLAHITNSASYACIYF